MRAIFLSFFRFGVGRPDWSLTLMAINTFTICPKWFYALNTMYIRNYRPYRFQVIFIVLLLLFCLQQHIKFYLLTSLEGRKIPNMATAYVHFIYFNIIFPHYFNISQKKLTARYGLLLLFLINFLSNLCSFHVKWRCFCSFRFFFAEVNKILNTEMASTHFTMTAMERGQLS